MSKSKRDLPATIDLADFLADARERRYTVKAGAETFKIDPPDIWPDAVAEAGKREDPIGMAVAIMGEEDYARWQDEGGSANALMGIIGKLAGASVPEA